MALDIQMPHSAAPEEPVPGPHGLMLSNFPNPFNPSTTIQYTLAQPGPIRLGIYNLRGQLIRTLVQASQPAGTHQINWDGRDEHGLQVASGIYLASLSSSGRTANHRMMLMK